MLLGSFHSVIMWSGVSSVGRRVLHSWLSVTPIVKQCLFIKQCPVIRPHIFLSSSLLSFSNFWVNLLGQPQTACNLPYFPAYFVVHLSDIFGP